METLRASEGDLEESDMEPAILLVSMLGNEHEAYWRRRYQKELLSLSGGVPPLENAEDPMERLFVWFGRLPLLMTAQMIFTELGLEPTASILDLGCGNGFMCEVLHALGFLNVVGSDYCPAAIILCQKVQRHFRQQQPSKQDWGTRYVCDDILRTRLPRAGFDLIHDCGTLDSIAMTLPAPDHTPAGADAAEPTQAREAAGSSGDSDELQRAAGGLSLGGPNADDEEDGAAAGDSEAEAVAVAAAAEAAVERGTEAEVWQGGGPAGYLRNAAGLLRAGGRLVIRSCSHSVADMERMVADARAPLVLARDASLAGTSVVTAVFALTPRGEA